MRCLCHYNWCILIKNLFSNQQQLVSKKRRVHTMGNIGHKSHITNNGIIQHSRLGLIKIVQNPDFDQDRSSEYSHLIYMQTNNMTQSEYRKWMDQLSFYKMQPKKHESILKKSKSQNNLKSHHIEPIPLTQEIRGLMFLPLDSSIKEKGFCGGACELQICYPNYSYVLRNEIQDRYKVQKSYNEAELWYLLYNLISLERFLYPYEKRIGNVHPKNILIHEQTGVMKIIIGPSIPKQKSAFQLICESQLQDVFLAPEQIDYTSIDKCRYPNINSNLAEIFSIGMTVLEAGTLQLSSLLYDRGPYRINTNKLKLNINIFKSKYGAFLTNIIEGMLSENPKTRRTPQQLYDTLSPYENEIINLESFTDKMFRPPTMQRGLSNQSHQTNVSNSVFNTTHVHNNTTLKSPSIKQELYDSNILGEPRMDNIFRKNGDGLLENSQYNYAFNSQPRKIYSPRVRGSTFTN